VDTVSATNSGSGSAQNVNNMLSVSSNSPVYAGYNSNNYGSSPGSSLPPVQAKKTSAGPPIIGNIIRKHLSHSISEERDESGDAAAFYENNMPISVRLLKKS
jgi:hypothetical protein